MDSGTKDITQIRVPPVDEALPKAFADLDAKLSAWRAVILELQAQLQEQISRQNELSQQLASRAAAQAERESQIEAQAAACAQAEQHLKAQAEAQAAMQAELQEQAASLEQMKQAGLPGDDRGSAPAGPRQWTSEDISKHIRVYGDFAKPVAEPEPRPATAETGEDEALLASLDPETAKAIRVMRRMSGGRKSVRELLEQYGATPPPSRSEPAKKSWFRRGR